MEKEIAIKVTRGKPRNQIICALLINFPVIVYGMAIGWMSPMTLLLQSENTPTEQPLSDTIVSWMASVPYIVCCIFAYIFGFIADKFGRKCTVMIFSISMIICWGILLVSLQGWAFVLSRCFLGVGMAAAYVTCPIYTKEISEDSIRGALGSLVILSQTSGNLIMYVLGDMLDYYTILWISISLPIAHVLVFMTMPESPSYLVKKERYKDAINSMAWLRCRNKDDQVVIDEIEALKKEQSIDEENTKLALRIMLSDRILFKAFSITMIVTMAREICGANPVLNFAGSIFDMASGNSAMTLSPNQQAVLLGLVQVIGAIVASTLVENAGRKPLLIITSFVSGASMCGLASWFFLQSIGIYGPSWIPITTLCLCIFCDAAGLQPLSIVLMNEIFSFRYRSTVSSIAMSTTSIADFLVLLFFKPLATMIGIHVSFYFFGGVCLLHAIYIIFVLPETKKRSVEEIYRKLGR